MVTVPLETVAVVAGLKSEYFTFSDGDEGQKLRVELISDRTIHRPRTATRFRHAAQAWTRSDLAWVLPPPQWVVGRSGPQRGAVRRR